MECDYTIFPFFCWFWCECMRLMVYFVPLRLVNGCKFSSFSSYFCRSFFLALISLHIYIFSSITVWIVGWWYYLFRSAFFSTFVFYNSSFVFNATLVAFYASSLRYDLWCWWWYMRAKMSPGAYTPKMKYPQIGKMVLTSIKVCVVVVCRKWLKVPLIFIGV